MSTRFALGLAAVTLLAGPVAAEHGEPLHIRNLNPLVAVFGLPAWDTVVPGRRFGASLEVANHYRFSLRGGDLLILDGETLRTNLMFSHGFDSGWSLGAEVPYYRQSGGFLDDVIDGWHSAFRLPDGGRNARPEGQLLFRMADSNGEFFLLDHTQSALGDVQLKVARGIGRERGYVVQASVKLPTGDEDILAGSGSTDWSLTLLRSQPLLGRRRPAGYYWGLGVVWAGEPERIRFDSETLVYTAIVGGTWQPWPKFGLTAQLDLHQPFYETQLEEIGESAIQASLGGWVYLGRRGRLDVAVVEDLEVSTAPDVVLHVAAQWQW